MNRVSIAALTLTAVGFVGILGYDGYSGSTIIPIPGDINGGERPFDRPPALQPSVDAFGRGSYLFGPLCHCFSLTEALYKNAVSFVARLLCVGCPPAILGGVGAVSVDSVEAAPVRSSPHVCKKAVKQAPSVTDGYAAPTITCEIPVAWVVTPSAHVAPSFIFFGGSSVVWVGRVSVSVARRAGSLPLQASARLGVSVSQLARIDDHVVTTTTRTQPSRALTLVRSLLKNFEPVKFLTGEVDEVRHSGFSYG